MQVEDEKPEEEIQLEEGIIEGDGVAEPEGAEEITETDEPSDVLPIKRIPIFPVLGERTWTESDNIIYRGLIAKGKTVQRIVNYSMTQLIERLQLSPKPQFRGYLESFKNLDKYYKKAGTGINPILPGQRLANDGKTQLPLPEVYNPNIQFADLSRSRTARWKCSRASPALIRRALPTTRAKSRRRRCSIRARFSRTTSSISSATSAQASRRWATR
jgi:hypothetical protein